MKKFSPSFKLIAAKALAVVIFFVLTYVCADFLIKPAAAGSLDCSSVEDAKADFLVQKATSTIEAVAPARADLESATLKFDRDVWIFNATTSDPLTINKNENYSLLLLIDTNSSVEDNCRTPNDRRLGGDTYFVTNAANTSTAVWAVKKYRFDVVSGKWQAFRTSSTAEVVDRTLAMKIPSADLPETAVKSWRVLTALGTQAWVSRDDLPDKRDNPEACGFMPVSESAYGSPMSKAPPLAPHGFWYSVWGDVSAVVLTALLLISIFGLSVWSSRRGED